MGQVVRQLEGWGGEGREGAGKAGVVQLLGGGRRDAERRPEAGGTSAGGVVGRTVNRRDGLQMVAFHDDARVETQRRILRSQERREVADAAAIVLAAALPLLRVDQQRHWRGRRREAERGKRCVVGVLVDANHGGGSSEQRGGGEGEGEGEGMTRGGEPAYL